MLHMHNMQTTATKNTVARVKN